MLTLVFANLLKISCLQETNRNGLRIAVAEHFINKFVLTRIEPSGAPELTQMLSLDFEQAGFHRGGAP